MTYSIVARDPDSGALGVAVQTCMFAVGAIVPWARPGVGAVATQAAGEPAYGPRVLDAISGGASAADALASAREMDPLAGFRQVGVVGGDGNVDAFTGEYCIGFAGHQLGDDYAVQANMMASPEVWPAMAAAFEGSSGPLAGRLMTALRAGESAGGDARGRMSAAMLVVDDAGTVVNVRVDHHPEPLDELARLLRAQEAFNAYSRSEDALVGGRAREALTEIDHALSLLPGDENMRFLRAGALLFNGRTEESQDAMSALIAERPSWRTILESFNAKGLIPLPPGVAFESFLPS